MLRSALRSRDNGAVGWSQVEGRAVTDSGLAGDPGTVAPRMSDGDLEHPDDDNRDFAHEHDGRVACPRISGRRRSVHKRRTQHNRVHLRRWQTPPTTVMDPPAMCRHPLTPRAHRQARQIQPQTSTTRPPMRERQQTSTLLQVCRVRPTMCPRRSRDELRRARVRLRACQIRRQAAMTELTAFGGLVEARGWPVAEHIDTTEWSPALEESYRTFAPALLGYFRSHRVDQAEDLVGDVFVSVAHDLRRFTAIPMTFVAGCSPSPTVAASTTFAAGVRRRVVAEAPPERACVDDRRDLDIDLVAALGELTPRQREVVILRFVADLPLEDVARIIGRRVGAVKALQARAIDHLARRLDRT